MLRSTYLNDSTRDSKFDSLRQEEEEEIPVFDIPEITFENKMVNMFSDLVGEKKKNQKVLGIVLMAAAGLFLTLGNSLVQYVFEKNPQAKISSFEVLFVRSLIQAFFTGLFMIHGKIHPYGNSKKNLIQLFLMGFVEAAAIVLIYLALERIPVGDATVIQFTAPIFTVLFSFIFLKICCGWVDTIFGIISFLGVVFIAKPSIIEGDKISPYFHHGHNIKAMNATSHNDATFSSEYVLGSGFALLGAMCLALFYILNKVNGKKHDVTLTIFYPSVVGIILSPIIMAIKNERVLITEIKGEYWGILFAVGFVAFIGLMFMAEALQLENPGPAVLIRNLDVIYAFVLQYLLMHHLPGLATLIGTLIVLSSSTVIALNRVFNFEKKLCGEKNGCKCLGKPSEKDEDGQEFLLDYQDAENIGED